MKLATYSLAACAAWAGVAVAATDPYPSTYQAAAAAPTLIRNATVLDGTGRRLGGADVLMRDGRIAAVGPGLAADVAAVVDARGRWVTPGLIDVHSHLGVYASPGVTAHQDGNEMTDPVTAGVWAEHALWPQDPGFAAALAGGVTTLQVLPGSANLIGGRGVTVVLIDNKVSTWPIESSRSYRAGKFTSTGIFDGFPPTEEQIARLAPNYDNILLGAKNSDLIPRFKKYNPDLTFLIYVDSGLNPDFHQADAGGVDEEDTEWIVEYHPDWILQDADGNFIRSGGGLSNPGEYWPDPGNPEWQNYFAEKVNKLLQETGGQWNGVLFDQFIGTADGHVRYAQADQQVNYLTDEAYQAAYLEFFRVVSDIARQELFATDRPRA